MSYTPPVNRQMPSPAIKRPGPKSDIPPPARPPQPTPKAPK